MDFSANLHHQLLQLENQLLLGSGSSHAWTPDISLSPSCDDFEPSFEFHESNPGTDAEIGLLTSLQESGYGSKDKEMFEEVKERDQNGSDSSCCCCSKIVHPTSNNLGFDHFASSSSSSHHHLLQPQSKTTTTSSLLTNMPNHEITQAKRACTLKEQKPTQSTPKKTRVEPRATCPPLKIKKEKLGDRIAALQQLVAPFGKTDTASVLMEAISYINFLQNQVEMLSHSYMKSCRNKNYETTCRDELNEKDNKSKSDLKAKGLCLVPLACISYLPEDISTGGRIGSIWPPLAAANFNRRSF